MNNRIKTFNNSIYIGHKAHIKKKQPVTQSLQKKLKRGLNKFNNQLKFTVSKKETT